MKRKRKIKPAVRANGQPKQPDGAKDMRTDEVRIKALEDAFVMGHTVTHACTLAGLHQRSYFRWMADGEVAAEGTLARQIWQRMKKAQADAIHRNLAVIQSAARKNWTAAAWFLERRCPDDYGRKLQTEVTGRGGGPVQSEDVTGQVDVKHLSSETLRELRDATARAGKG
jgi:hypothetical protein